MKEFLVPYNWFYEKYHGNLALRYWSFKVALNLFLQRGMKYIFEMGTVKELNDWGSGNSTVVFGDFCSHYGRRLFTIDNNSFHIERSKELTKDYKKHIKYVVCDSVEFLTNLELPIGFLYLDSFDYIVDENYKMVDPGQCLFSQEHNLEEIKAAEKNLIAKSIILIDDSDMDGGGKPGLSFPYLLSKGWEVVLHSQQLLMIRK